MTTRRPTVILRDCREYDAQRIRSIVRAGLERLELRPHGNTLIKPNVVAAGYQFPHAYTRPEFTEGVVLALRDRDDGRMASLRVGERSGITMPTRFAFDQAGYRQMAARTGTELVHFEEVPQVEIPLYHANRLRDSLFTPQAVAEADFFVNCPKFKAHPWTTVTFSLKSYIGIQDDRHRLLDHHHKLDTKLADLQYIIQPQFIAIDAITAGEGRMLTPIPFALGLVIMGDNQVAIDAVCCRIIGLDPMTVPHIRMAWEQGFGPIDLDQIDVEGDVDLVAARQRAQGFRVGLVRVEDYFAGTSIQAYGGTPPGAEAGGPDYCWGGCPGALEEAIEILRLYDAAAADKLPRTHVVFGRWDQPLDVKPGERVVLMGDCASYRGPIGAKSVEIASEFHDRSGLSPLDAKHDDIFVKIASVKRRMWTDRREQIIRINGCPVSVAEQVLALVELSSRQLPNPYFDMKVAPSFISAYFSWRTRTLVQRMFGQPYNQPGEARRGQARPVQNLRPSG